MAIGTNLPPQAYTRETLTQAFHWLNSQPESIKKQAPTPDALVALYVRSQKYQTSVHAAAQTTPRYDNDAPVSAQNFISDLKNLAEGLKQFNDEDPASENFIEKDLNPAFERPMAQGSLHPRAQQMIKEVREHFCLSSDAEATSMMISIAYKNLKNLLV